MISLHTLKFSFYDEKMNLDEILVYCDKHKGYQNCKCNEHSKYSKQTNIHLVESKNVEESISASKAPQFVAAIVGMSLKYIHCIYCKCIEYSSLIKEIKISFLSDTRFL